MTLAINQCLSRRDYDSSGFLESKSLEHELKHQPLKNYFLTPRFLEAVGEMQNERKLSHKELIHFSWDFTGETDYERIGRRKREKLKYFVHEFCGEDEQAKNLGVKESANVLGYAGSLIVSSGEKLREEDFQFFDIDCLGFYKRFLNFMERTPYFEF